jgi:hypothetical protein
VFAATLLLIAGTLNIIYGIGAPPQLCTTGVRTQIRGSAGDAGKGAYVRLQADAALPCAE